MKKKLFFLPFSCLLVLLFTGCNEVFLSVVTVDKDGEKIVNNYVSMFEDKVYDKTASFKSWRDIEILNDDDFSDMDNLHFLIENKKENIVVFGYKNAAIEICFFDGGYKYTVYSLMDNLYSF